MNTQNPNHPSHIAPRFDTHGAAGYSGIAASTLNKLRLTNQGPIFLKIGRRVIYERESLDLWLAGQATRQLAHNLTLADDGDFMLLVWATNALQSGNLAGAATVLRSYPAAAATEEMGGPLAIYPWELETLTNELLTTPKHRFYRAVDCSVFTTIQQAVNLLRQIDNLEYAENQKPEDIFTELYRIGSRQFQWQRGYFNVPQFYRWIFIYGQGISADFFEKLYGISISDLSMVGFTLYAGFSERPNFTATVDFDFLGLGPERRDKALDMLCAPVAHLRELAPQFRSNWDRVSYRPSVLRRFPCVRLGRRRWQLRCPLPELIVERITSGLFYDLVNAADGRVRNDYGHRFEQYALDYLRAMFPKAHAIPEWRYKIARGRFNDSPDIVVSHARDAPIEFVIECKASRMSSDARFADEPTADRGFEDMAKGVFQLWRFFSHCRRGLSARDLAPDVVGLVLTLDPWFVMGTSLFEDVFDRAKVLAREKEPEIEAQDCKPVAFCVITDFESALSVGTLDTLQTALLQAAVPERRGGYITDIHRNLVDKEADQRDYPFRDLAALLPWWAQFAGAVEARQ